MKRLILCLTAMALLLIGGQAWADYLVTDLTAQTPQLNENAFVPSFVTAMNNSDELVGWSFTAPLVEGGGSYNALLYSNGVVIDLGTLPGFSNSIAYGLNDSGQVVGESFKFNQSNDTADTAAFIYGNGTMASLPPLPGYYGNSVAYGINDSGEVVGYAYNSVGVVRAFLYNNGTMADLGTLGGVNSVAYGITESSMRKDTLFHWTCV